MARYARPNAVGVNMPRQQFVFTGNGAMSPQQGSFSAGERTKRKYSEDRRNVMMNQHNPSNGYRADEKRVRAAPGYAPFTPTQHGVMYPQRQMISMGPMVGPGVSYSMYGYGMGYTVPQTVFSQYAQQPFHVLPYDASAMQPAQNTSVPGAGASAHSHVATTKNGQDNSHDSSEQGENVAPYNLPAAQRHNYNRNGNIGVYSPMERASLLKKFMAKRKKRRWNKVVAYECRKNLAQRRVRIKGRFIKRDPKAESSASAPIEDNAPNAISVH